MEKLIELLNEFNPSMEWRMEDGVLESKLNFPAEYVAYRWICSKNYGFIKWLVENEKIHREKIPAVTKVDGYLADGSDTEYYNMEESLLMLLSISDKPIEFLISILKNV